MNRAVIKILITPPSKYIKRHVIFIIVRSRPMNLHCNLLFRAYDLVYVYVSTPAGNPEILLLKAF